ncbi:MAG: UTRA domain-containing protein [Mycetocola sp.]
MSTSQDYPDATESTGNRSSRRAYELIRSALRTGDIRSDRDLSAASLVRRTGVSRQAVASAVDRLVHQGLIRPTTKLGKSPAAVMLQLSVDDFVPNSQRKTLPWPDSSNLQIALLEHRMVQSTPVIRERMRTSADYVLMVEGLGRVGKEVVVITVGYYAEPNPDEIIRRSIECTGLVPMLPLAEWFSTLFDVPFGRCDTTIEAVRSDAVTTRQLGVAEGSVALLRESLLVDADGRPRCLSYSHYRADRVSLADIGD